MKLIQRQVTIKTIINRNTFEVQFTPHGNRVATWQHDTNPGIHFYVWDEEIIYAFCELTEAYGDITLMVGGETKRKNNRTEFTVKKWSIIQC